MERAIKILEKRERYWLGIKRAKDQQNKAKKQIEDQNLDSEDEAYRIIRLAGDPIFFDEQEMKDITQALMILRSAI